VGLEWIPVQNPTADSDVWLKRHLPSGVTARERSGSSLLTEIGCMAHARRKFYDLHQTNKSEVAAQALEYIGQLYHIERALKELPPDKRQSIKNQKARPIADALHQ
jgi:hypothetical protein